MATTPRWDDGVRQTLSIFLATDPSASYPKRFPLRHAVLDCSPTPLPVSLNPCLTLLVLAVTPSPTLDSSNRLTLCPTRPLPGSPSQPLSHGSGATPQPASDRTVYRQSSLSRLSLSLSSRSGSRFSILPKSPIEMQTPYQLQEITLVVTQNRFWLSLRQSK